MLIESVREEDTRVGWCPNLVVTLSYTSTPHLTGSREFFQMGQNASRQYATDDPELIKSLQSVMGNKRAANLFWSCLLEDECTPVSFLEALWQEHASSSPIHCEEMGTILSSSLTQRLDAFCLDLGLSRFAVILSAYAVLVERYIDSPSFWMTHNYGVTGSINRILQHPVTRVHLCHEDASLSFRELCLAQGDIIQKSSYHLCIPKLPSDFEIERSLGVFLLDPKSGHTRSLIQDVLTHCKLPLIVEIGINGELTLQINYKACTFSAQFVSQFLGQFVFTLEQCLSNPDIDDVRLQATVPPDQREEHIDQSVFKLPYESSIIFPELECTLDELIRRQAENSPDSVALQQFNSGMPSRMTYKELLERSTELKVKIQRLKLGIDGNGRIGILLNRGMNQIIALLGVLMAGCAYVPLDPINHPPERIDFILRDSGAVALITESSVGVARSFYSKLPCIDICDENEIVFDDDTTLAGPKSSSVAYVIYTSGSTGNPKGVVVPHRGIVNDIFCVYKQFMNSKKEYINNVLFSTNICFDAHVDEVFLPLVFGGTITCIDTNIAHTELCPEWNLTFVQSTPSVFQVIKIPDSVRCVLIGGEALTKATIEKVSRNQRLLINGYGPTETTNESSLHVVRNVEDFRSIGKPIWNTQFYIMDKSGKNLVPKFAWGELFIGGIGVTQGYSNLPELTARMFTTLPTGEKVYKTGDIVRINANGDLEFKGRAAHCSQIKLRGYRIELGEIQYAILSNNPEIREAHVCMSQIGDSQQLVAYVAPEVATEAIKYGQLPEYMKPSIVITVKSFPRNIAGKLDVKSLPNPGTVSNRSSGELRSTAARVARTFQETLGLEESAINDDTNFFSIGGNSLNVLLVKSKLVETFEVHLPLQSLFRLQTVREIAKYIDSHLTAGGDSTASTAIFDDLIVPMGGGKGSGAALFCIHAAGGQVHTYSALASALSGISFFGIQDPSLSQGSSHRLTSFESMGALYAKRIHEFVKDDGPIFIAGHSSGGSIAFETAKSLETDFSRKIGCVFMIDTECVTNPSGDPPQGMVDRLDEIRYYLYSGWKEGLVEDYINAMTTVSEANGVKTWQLLKAILPTRRSTTKRWSSDLIEMISLLSHHLQIEKRYSPLGSECVNFPLLLFRPADEENDEPEWKQVTNNRFMIVDVPNANHYTLVREPAVKIIATVIKDIIETDNHSRGKTVRVRG
jgi:amino acid adenylation domain-containing protein